MRETRIAGIARSSERRHSSWEHWGLGGSRRASFQGTWSAEGTANMGAWEARGARRDTVGIFMGSHGFPEADQMLSEAPERPSGHPY